MAYLHPDKLVSVERIVTRKKARRRPNPNLRKQKKVVDTGNLVHNLAQHIYATRQARGS